ncbi:PLP-dependent aminotransferase family protein [Heyndrickxia ginsengihumi]|uniref:MocR-like pyridoxine biosynthesis transcription factor PdxR n=1 Tax=Heyndrickxia ginsengihumi TaxID=363870 RepID=UPI003D1DA609
MDELLPNLSKKAKQPLYIQLYNYIKKEILAGRIKSKEKLPSKRKLSQHLGISLNTVQAAYDQLCAEGFIERKPRQGLFVTLMEEDLSPYQMNEPKMEVIKVHEQTTIDFNSGKVDTAHFPFTLWRQLTVQSLYREQGNLFYNGDPQGEPYLRQEIAKYLFASRGVICSPDQIVIGAGTQLLIGLLCLIIGRNFTFAIENPGFHRIRTVLQDQGVNTAFIPLDYNGIDVHLLSNTDAHVAYVTPSHQFPYGMVMPISRRIELLKWAEERDAYIVEDDYDGEYRYKGKPIPSLQGLDAREHVIYLGSFSKSLIPSLRISYMVLPPALLNKYQERFMIYKQTVSRLHQDTLFQFMKEGHWERHLNRMRTLYRKKHHVLLLSINKYMKRHVKIIGEHAGLHIVLEVNNRMSEKELIESAIYVGVKIYPLSIYYTDVEKELLPKVILGFGGLSESEIEKGIQLIAEAWNIL